MTESVLCQSCAISIPPPRLPDLTPAEWGFASARLKRCIARGHVYTTSRLVPSAAWEDTQALGIAAYGLPFLTRRKVRREENEAKKGMQRSVESPRARRARTSIYEARGKMCAD